MNSRFTSILLILGWASIVYAQDHPNLVPNSGFESFSSYPVGWFYTGKHFSNVVKYWSSPTAASPDAYGPNIFVPKFWKDKGFGDTKPHGGESMAGLTVYGCEDGKPHCREYIQIPLIEPLVVGQRYRYGFWISHLPKAYKVKDLHISFAPNKTYIDQDVRLSDQTLFELKNTQASEDGLWLYFEGEFVAKTIQDFMIIGNFNSDNDTRLGGFKEALLNYGYVYVDDVELRKMEPILSTPVLKSTWEDQEIKKGIAYRLNNIYFDTDKAELLPKSFVELDKLVQLMNDYPNMIIEIDGHTDSQGDQVYNHILSINRAKAVVDYLNQAGISNQRTMSRGFGKSTPIADNETATGRQLNRRVEFKVISF